MSAAPLLELVPEAKDYEHLLSILVSSIVRALELYGNIAPGDRFDKQTVAGGLSAPATPTFVTLVTFDTLRSDGVVIAGIGTSPTQDTVRYRLKINDQVVLDADHQLATDLATLYPINIRVKQGPVKLVLEAGSLGVLVPNVFGRIAGYWVGTGPFGAPRRMEF